MPYFTTFNIFITFFIMFYITFCSSGGQDAQTAISSADFRLDTCFALVFTAFFAAIAVFQHIFQQAVAFLARDVKGGGSAVPDFFPANFMVASLLYVGTSAYVRTY